MSANVNNNFTDVAKAAEYLPARITPFSNKKKQTPLFNKFNEFSSFAAPLAE
ncbi:hypothetical protein GGER_49780 [Serratia rubidaea]